MKQVVHIRLEKEVLQRLKRKAKLECRTVSNVINMLLSDATKPMTNPYKEAK